MVKKRLLLELLPVKLFLTETLGISMYRTIKALMFQAAPKNFGTWHKARQTIRSALPAICMCTRSGVVQLLLRGGACASPAAWAIMHGPDASHVRLNLAHRARPAVVHPVFKGIVAGGGRMQLAAQGRVHSGFQGLFHLK